MRTVTGVTGRPSSVADIIRVPDGRLLTGYLDDVVAATRRFVAAVSDADLDRVVDEAWDPPVTLGVRMVSVVGDDLQHLGQAAFIRGLLTA